MKHRCSCIVKTCFLLTSMGLLYRIWVMFIAQTPPVYIPHRILTGNFCTGENLAYEYVWQNEFYTGEHFDKAWLPYLHRYGLCSNQLARRESDSLIFKADPVFVTAWSKDHFQEAIDCVIDHFMSNFINQTLIVYDLGLTTKQLTYLSGLNVDTNVRKFPFGIFPQYFQTLKEYRWKPLVIADVLKDHAAVWWMDSSVVWERNDNLKTVYDKIGTNQTYAHVSVEGSTHHSIFAATHDGMYDYLPIDFFMTKETEMSGATFQLIFGTQEVLQWIIKWWVLCSLEESCMGTKGVQQSDLMLHCNFDENFDGLAKKFAKCHRFDQSALSILLANRNNYSISRYMVNVNASISRGSCWF